MKIKELKDNQIYRLVDFLSYNNTEGYTTEQVEKAIALALHLDLEISDLRNMTNPHTNIYEIYGETYLILTDYEADEESERYVENLIEDCYLWELRKQKSPILFYIDIDKWVNDWSRDRGQNLSVYDGNEYYEKVNGIYYYIYRTN